jgi:ketosteroid isomerase-like protein
MLRPGHEPIRDSAGIQAFWDEVMTAGIKSVQLETMEVESGDDEAHELGRYTLRGADGQALDQGKYVVLWRREADGWKLHWDSIRTASILFRSGHRSGSGPRRSFWVTQVRCTA